MDDDQRPNVSGAGAEQGVAAPRRPAICPSTLKAGS